MARSHIKIPHILDSLDGNGDSNRPLHTSPQASLEYLRRSGFEVDDSEMEGDELLVPGANIVSRLETRVADDQEIVGFSVPKFTYPLLAGNAGRDLSLYLVQKPGPENGAVPLPDGISFHEIRARTEPMRNIHSPTFQRQLQEVIERSFGEMLVRVLNAKDASGQPVKVDDKNWRDHVAVQQYADSIYGEVSKDVLKDAQLILAPRGQQINMVPLASMLPAPYQGLDVHKFIPKAGRNPPGQSTPDRKWWKVFQRRGPEPIVFLDESYGNDIVGAYPMLAKLSDQPLWMTDFAITDATIGSFSKSIARDPALHKVKYGDRLSTIVAAYVTVEPLLEYGKKFFPDEIAITAAQKLEAFKGKEVNTLKVYGGQTVLVNTAAPAPSTGIYHIVIGLTKPVRTVARSSRHWEQFSYGYMVLTPDYHPFLLGETDGHRIITPKKD
jgi:hypothetical protein